MSAELQPNGWYKLDFTIEQDGYTFTDALWFSPEEYAAGSDIAALQQARFAAWLAVVTAPAVEEIELENPIPLPSEG